MAKLIYNAGSLSVKYRYPKYKAMIMAPPIYSYRRDYSGEKLQAADI